MAQNPEHSAVPASLGSGVPSDAARPAVNPASLSIDEVSRLLSAAGGKRVAPERVQADLNAGAPVGPDGRINLVHYTAWLAREVQAK